MTRNNGNNWNNVGLRHLAVVTAIATLVLVLAGGLVTTTESGDDIPTWPTGKLVGYEGALGPSWARGVRWLEEHVAAAQQAVGAHGVQDHA